MVKYILSIDGGGIKGLIPCVFLYYLDIFLNENGTNIHDFFDMFAGSSVGSLIVGAIAYEKMSGNNLLNQLYTKENIHEIMSGNSFEKDIRLIQQKPKYDGKGKTKIIKKYVGDRYIQDSNGKDVLITTFKVCSKRKQISSDEILINSKIYSKENEIIVNSNKEPFVFKSWESGIYKITEVLDASSAPPIYFPSVNVNKIIIHNDYEFLKEGLPEYDEFFECIDGSVSAPDPALCAYIEAIKKYGIKEDIRILSIGTGIYTNANIPDNNWGFKEWLTRGDILGLLENGQKNVSQNVLEELTKMNGHRYLRADIPILNGSLDDTSDENIRLLKKYGEELWGIYESEFNQKIFKKNDSIFTKIIDFIQKKIN